MSRIHVGHVASLRATVIICDSTHAGVVGFQESFSQGAANWRGSTSATALNWSTVGSPIDEAFVTSNFNLANTQSGGIPATIIRAAASAGSSAGAYQRQPSRRWRHWCLLLVSQRPRRIDRALLRCRITAELPRSQCLRWPLNRSQHLRRSSSSICSKSGTNGFCLKETTTPPHSPTPATCRSDSLSPLPSSDEISTATSICRDSRSCLRLVRSRGSR